MPLKLVLRRFITAEAHMNRGSVLIRQESPQNQGAHQATAQEPEPASQDSYLSRRGTDRLVGAPPAEGMASSPSSAGPGRAAPSPLRLPVPSPRRLFPQSTTGTGNCLVGDARRRLNARAG